MTGRAPVTPELKPPGPIQGDGATHAISLASRRASLSRRLGMQMMMMMMKGEEEVLTGGEPSVPH